MRAPVATINFAFLESTFRGSFDNEFKAATVSLGNNIASVGDHLANGDPEKSSKALAEATKEIMKRCEKKLLFSAESAGSAVPVLPGNQLRNLSRRASDPETDKDKVEREETWLKVQEKRKQAVSLYTLPRDKEQLTTLIRKHQIAKKVNVSKESHQGLFWSADLCTEVSREPWAQLTNISSLDVKERVGTSSSIWQAETDWIICFDGRSSSTRKLLNEAFQLLARLGRHIEEGWVVFAGELLPKRAGKVRRTPFASIGVENVSMCLPCARTRLEVKSRGDGKPSTVCPAFTLEEGKRPPPPRQESASGLY